MRIVIAFSGGTWQGVLEYRERMRRDHSRHETEGTLSFTSLGMT